MNDSEFAALLSERTSLQFDRVAITQGGTPISPGSSKLIPPGAGTQIGSVILGLVKRPHEQWSDVADRVVDWWQRRLGA